jgi:integrase/recombinase XerD
MKTESACLLIKNYYKPNKPKVCFTENPKRRKYSPASIRAFLKKSLKLAGITKTVNPHTLKHTYATHLLENGVDIRYIQSLLGHSKPETRMIYTHVAKKYLLDITSSLDTILLTLN